MINNIFEIIQPTSDKELTDVLFQNSNIEIERIVSYGLTTPEGFWYNQDKNEWVLLLTGEAEIEYKNGEKRYLKAGDYLMIPSHQEHRVSFTSKQPNASWLCFYFK
jgi:cupin 2 domain-containing protein